MNMCIKVGDEDVGTVACKRPEEGPVHPELELIDSYGPQPGCWDTSLGPPEDTLLAAEPLQAP